MVESSDTMDITMSYSEIFEVTSALLDRAQKLIDLSAPVNLIETTLSRAKRFNDILVQAGYDHWTPECFMLSRKRRYNV